MRNWRKNWWHKWKDLFSRKRNWNDKIGIHLSPVINDCPLTLPEPFDFRGYCLRWALKAFISQKAHEYDLAPGEEKLHALSDMHHITIKGPD